MKNPEEEACSICGKPATIHCVDCKKSLCQPCQTNHNAFMKDHMFITISELRSGQFSDEGRFCQLHGEQVRYFCETEQKQACPDCVSLHTCAIEHKRVTLKEAAKKQVTSFQTLIKKCDKSKGKIQEAIDDATKVLNDLNLSRKQAIAELEQEFTMQKEKVNKMNKGMEEAIEEKLKTLRLQKHQIAQACTQAQELSDSKSEYQITCKYSSLAGTLKSLSQVTPQGIAKETVDFQIDVPKFELTTKSVSKTKPDALGTWEFRRQFHPQRLNSLRGIAINRDGDIAIGSWERGVKLYTKNLKEKGTIDTTFTKKGWNSDTSLGVVDIAVTPDNRYVIAPVNEQFLQFHDEKGKHLFTKYIKDVDNERSNLNAVATDARGRILVGQVQNTLSVHYADGSPISKFVTKRRPYRLDVTQNNEIVCSFYEDQNPPGKNTYLQMFDFSGMNSRVIQPPPEVTVWSPSYILCSEGEIFVSNNQKGYPSGVYRYACDGTYLDCVTKNVGNPAGLAMSNDGRELFVVDGQKNVMMIFNRVYKPT